MKTLNGILTIAMMASSSLSQEDFEHDYEYSNRRSRVRSARANARNIPPSRLGDSSSNMADIDTDSNVTGSGTSLTPGTIEATDVNLCVSNLGTVDHEASPKPPARAKDKRCPRPNHVNKGKAQRERRKLREKRRSTGVVHLPSTESTGGSTGEDDSEINICAETKKNTAYNEMPLDDTSNGTELAIHARTFASRIINKSPSDLDADDEDNQDYDSAVNQSDSTVSLFQDAGVNGQNVTPAENINDLVDNKHLLELVKQKDDRIAFLEQQISSLIHDLAVSDAENKKLSEENRSLSSALAELKN